MMLLYSAIVIVSALLCSWGSGRVAQYVLRELGMDPDYAQLSTVGSAVMFLTVISLPAGVVIGAALLIALGLGESRMNAMARWLAIGLACALGVVGVMEVPEGWPVALPLVVLDAGLVFFGYVIAARTMVRSTRVFSLATIAAGIPLAVSPLLYSGAHSSLAIDAAVIVAALLGGMHGWHRHAAMAACVRVPMALLLAYGAVQALRYGAWPMALASAGIWVGALVAAPKRAHA